MSSRKQRMSRTVDRAPVQAHKRRAKDRYLRGLAHAIAAYEAEFGVISDEELIAQQREDLRTAIRVRRTHT